ncbi:Cof-type HAD-IIB family hydrolase [Streptomyces sp. NPDC047085]|uniref:Cof-type HAD-IIB family hydrolase n=1 Tax=Streptomyces sp. NPDC047085 TaxID=3155140 RepID=UPI0033C6D8FB
MTTTPKLVATDLDGTLLHSDGSLSERTRAALTAASKAGIRIAFVTGRPPRCVPTLLETIGRHHIIAANGAALYAPDATTIHISPIRSDAATELVPRLRDAVPGVPFAVEYETVYGHEPDYPNWSFGTFGTEPVELIDSVEDLLAPAPGRHVLKLLAHHPTLPLDVFHEQARRSAGNSAETTHSTGLSLVEFSAPGVTKAATLLAWSSRLGITADEIAAFGDMPNDLPMLKAVGTSYAMANAHPDVLRTARGRTASNDEDGVAQALERFVRRVGVGQKAVCC